MIFSETWAALLILMALAALGARPIRQLYLTLVLLVVFFVVAWVPAALVTFMKEHYARNIAFDAVLEGRTFTAWQCRSEDAPKRPPVAMSQGLDVGLGLRD